MIRLFVIGQCILAPLPGLLITALFALSARATALIGTLPLAFQNDPGHIGINDPIYQTWYGIADWLFLGTLFSAFLWFPSSLATAVLCLQAWRNGQRRWPLIGGIAILTYLAGLLVIMFEPTNRLGWYLD